MSNILSSEEKKYLFLQEYTEKYIHLVPEYLRDNDSFLVFFALLCNEFNITLDNIRSFTDIVDPDKVPAKFLEYLGMYFNYHYQDRASEAFNRELLQRNRLLYEDRGTPHSIIMAASHGDNEGYLGGDIFIPGYDISKELAELTVGRDKIFIHSKSKFSSTSVYSDDARYRPGVIIISLAYIDNDIRNKLWEVIPAGVRVMYNLISDFKPNEQDPSPDGIYDFIPETGAPKSPWGTLTWYPYFRVKPIFGHGDVNPYGYDYYDLFRNNFPIGLDLFIEMGIDQGLMADTLFHSDGTLNKRLLFDADGKLIGNYNDIRLSHGRKYHSGTMVVSDFTEYMSSIGVSAYPLSFVRRPFKLSSIPVGAPQDTLVDDINSKIKTEYEQYYSDHTEEIPDEDRKYYKITPTGEYEDRIDKLTTDSVMRGFDITLEVDRSYPYRYHNTRIRSSSRGLHSGTVQSMTYWESLRDVFRDGVHEDGYDAQSWVDKLDGHYAESTLSGYIDDLINAVHSEGESNDILDFNNLLYQQEVLIKELQIEYDHAEPGSQEKADLEVQLEEARHTLSLYSNELLSLREIIEGTMVIDYIDDKPVDSHLEGGVVQKVLEILDADIQEDDPERKAQLEAWNKELKSNFLSCMGYYKINNPIHSGIYVPGDMSEYVAVQTMQPSDNHYAISEVLDVRADYNRPWDRVRWIDGEEDSYGLNQYGENRDPSLQLNADICNLRELFTEGSEYVDCSTQALGFEIEEIS